MEEKTLYLECYSGISGDMTVAALLDLGADQQVLMEGLESLKVDGYRIAISHKDKNSINACDFNVILDTPSGHEHTHEHNHNHTHHDDETHPHTHHREHIHASASIPQPVQVHSHHTHSEGHHEHRNLTMIRDIILKSSITENAKAIALRIFNIIAAAEAKAHAKPIEEVHFHEVGAIDSIVDIVAAAICLDNLKIKDVVISELYEGTGFIPCQHGLLPVPVPAVINIAKAHALPLHITSVQGELVTPTGAAIAAAIRTKASLPNNMKITKIGLGAGKRNYAGASGLLRAMLIKPASSSPSETAASDMAFTDQVWVLEANIDDCSGEALGYTMELLLQNGAKDVYYTPIYMKKNRPAYLLGVICSDYDIKCMEEIIFTNTTTIGIRRQEVSRTILNRETITVTTPYGDALLKICTYQDKKYYYPEYESVKKLCEASGIDYPTLYRQIQEIAQRC